MKKSFYKILVYFFIILYDEEGGALWLGLVEINGNHMEHKCIDKVLRTKGIMNEIMVM